MANSMLMRTGSSTIEVTPYEFGKMKGSFGPCIQNSQVCGGPAEGVAGCPGQVEYDWRMGFPGQVGCCAQGGVSAGVGCLTGCPLLGASFEGMPPAL